MFLFFCLIVSKKDLVISIKNIHSCKKKFHLSLLNTNEAVGKLKECSLHESYNANSLDINIYQAKSQLQVPLNSKRSN